MTVLLSFLSCCEFARVSALSSRVVELQCEVNISRLEWGNARDSVFEAEKYAPSAEPATDTVFERSSQSHVQYEGVRKSGLGLLMRAKTIILTVARHVQCPA